MSYGGMSKKDQQEIRNEVNKPREASKSRESTKAVYKAFCEAVKRIEDTMKYDNDFKQLYGPKGMKVIKDAYKVVKVQSEEIFNGRENPPTKEEQEIIHRALNVLQDVLLVKPIVPFIRDLSIEFARLVMNWDRALCKCQPIRRKCLVVDQLAKGHLSLVAAMDVLKGLVAKGQRHLQYTPPAFEISRHYLELDKE